MLKGSYVMDKDRTFEHGNLIGDHSLKLNLIAIEVWGLGD